MATNNAINASKTGFVHYNGSGTFTAPSTMMAGNNCSFWNLSFTHATGILTIAGADGTALSATNPAYITIPSNVTKSQMVTYTITDNIVLTVSELTGNIGNMTASTAYSQAFPLYIGLMGDENDDNVIGCLTWLPHVYKAPSNAGDIGDPSAANADVQYSAFSFSDITEADYTGSNIGLIGAVSATKDASDIYTLETIDGKYEGTGKWNENRYFLINSGGLFGAAANSLILANGGTAPTFSTINYTYQVRRNGDIEIMFSLSGDGGTDGVGAVDANVVLPYSVNNQGTGTQNKVLGCGYTSSASITHTICNFITDNSNFGTVRFNQYNTATFLQNQDYGNGNRAIYGQMIYNSRNAS